MLGLELVVALGGAILVSGLAGRRLNVAPPVFLLLAGVLIGLIPQLRHVELPPEVVLLLFLPALLFWESLTTSLREIRRDLRGILLTGTVLVIVSAGAVAAVAHALGMPWGPAWVLGAAVAPTDATAVGIVARLLPRRNVTLLRAESLINDGTALVVYGLAVGITAGSEHLGALHVGWLFLRSYLGGAAAGALTGWAAVRLRRHVDPPLLANTVTLLSPFVAYLIAEKIGGSGVLATVAAGLVMSQSGPRVGRSDTRLMSEAFWTLSTFILNSVLFVLVGLELWSAVQGLSTFTLGKSLAVVALVAAILIGARVAFLFAAAHTIRALDRRPQQRERRVSARARIVSSLAGFRGAVSLAAALSVPHTIDGGAPFPDRDVIIFVTAGVIVATLVLQALVLPIVVRWAQLPADDALGHEQHLAQAAATRAALDALPQAAAQLGTDPRLAEELTQEYLQHLHALDAEHGGDTVDPSLLRHQQSVDLRLALLANKRATLLRLRDENTIDDTVLRRLQKTFDIEELRLGGTEDLD